MQSIELRRLRYFTVVAEELHVGRAAERLNMTQQPLSAAIRQLEQEVGFDLFERYANRIRLTRAGTVFLQEARELLALAERAIDRGRRAARGEYGTLRLGFCTTATEALLPAAVAQFKYEHPGVGFDLRHLMQTEQLAALERGEIDIGFCYRPFDEAEYAAVDLLQERLMIVAPATHRVAALDAVTPRDLDGLPLIALSARRHDPMRRFIDGVFGEAGSAMRLVQELDDPAAAIALVAAGVGVALVPERVSVMRMRAGLVARPLVTAQPLQFAIVWSRRRPDDLLRRRFIDVVLNTRPAAAASWGQETLPVSRIPWVRAMEL